MAIQTIALVAFTANTSMSDLAIEKTNVWV